MVYTIFNVNRVIGTINFGSNRTREESTYIAVFAKEIKS